VNEKHFHRLKALLASGKVVVGGETKAEQLYIAPTVLTEVSETSPIMREEIFGPLLPIQTYQNFEEAIQFVKDREKPLALYLFSKDRNKQEQVLRELSFGGGCLNDTLVHLQNPELPFGGVGPSGMGAYHGEIGFQELSHRKSIFVKPFYLDLAVRYPPYGNRLGWFKKWLG
jgi:aldehyde dehydrogenase (NAD+)